MEEMVSVYKFDSYRNFLKAWIEWAKAQKYSNMSRLAEACQVHPTFLSHVLAGTKDLSLEQAALMSEHIHFTKLEKEYFFTIIQWERAGNLQLKKYWQERKKEVEQEKNKLTRRFEKHRQLNEEQRALFYSSWIYSAVYAATAIGDGLSLQQLADMFKMTRAKMEEVTSVLVQSGLCRDKKGIFSIGDTHVHITNESPHVLKHHSNWRMKALQKSETREPTELFFTCPMSISKKDFEKIREKLNVTVKQIVDMAQTSEAEDVVCLSIDFFRAE